MAESKPTYVQKFLRNNQRTVSESSESSIGADSLSELEMDIAQKPRNRAGSVNSRDDAVATTNVNTNTENKLENQLYDKYLAK